MLLTELTASGLDTRQKTRVPGPPGGRPANTAEPRLRPRVWTKPLAETMLARPVFT